MSCFVSNFTIIWRLYARLGDPGGVVLSKEPCLIMRVSAGDEGMFEDWELDDGGKPDNLCIAILSHSSALLSLTKFDIIENFPVGHCDDFLGITGELGLEESGEENGDDAPLPLANGDVCDFFRQLSTGDFGAVGELGNEAQIRSFGANFGEPSMFSVGGGQGVILRMRVAGDIGASF